MRTTDLSRDQIAPLIAMSEARQRAFIGKMTPADLLKFDASFETWAQAGQRPPPGEGWRVWLMMAGRGYGKTRAGAEWVHGLAMSASKRRIALVGATIDEARAVMVDGESGVIAVAERFGMKLRVSGRDVFWPNGSMATLYSGDSPEGLRGPAHHFAWCAADDRYCRCGGGRECRQQHAPREPGRWAMPCGRDRADRGLGGACQGHRGLCAGRVAVRRGGGGDECARQGERADREL